MVTRGGGSRQGTGGDTLAKVTVTGEYVEPVPTSNVRATFVPVATGLRRLPLTKPLVRPTDVAVVRTRVLAPVVTTPLVRVRADGRVRLPPLDRHARGVVDDEVDGVADGGARRP